jgi:radical SAM superfamily enzyme YgiQ (UPF0313 family)
MVVLKGIFMKRNILLINPWIYDFAAYDFWIKPIGLLYIASVLRKNGYGVQFLDCLHPVHPELNNDAYIRMSKKRHSGQGKFPREVITKPDPLIGIPRNYSRYGVTPRILTDELKKRTRPDLIFITSMMTYWYPGVFEVIRLVKRLMPDVPVVIGGNYVTLCREHALSLGADVTVSGEGEKYISPLLKTLLGDELSDIPDRHHLDSYPYPAFDLLPLKDQLPILTSRGCPYQCKYCASFLLNEGFKRRDPIRVVDEIAYWNSHFGIRHFSFYDDALLVHPEELSIPMLSEIIRKQLPCQFHCPNGLHLREITDHLSRLMFRAGFKTIRFGFETSNEKRQTDTGGKVSNEQLREAVMHLKRAGYQSRDIGIYLLCGLPGQEAEEVRESIEYVKSCGARPIITEYSPIPGTPLWEASVTASSYNLVGEPLFHNNSLLPCQWEKLTFAMYQELKLLTRNA